MPGQEESVLVELARDGDLEALGEIAKRYQASLRAFVACYVPNAADVMDIVQDAFLSAFGSLDRFDTERELGPWLRAICRNMVRNFYRRKSRDRVSSVQLVDEAMADFLAADPMEPDGDKGWGEDIVEALKHCVQTLNKKYQDLVRLRYFDNLSLKQMASRFDDRYWAVSQRLFRVRQALKKCIQKQLKAIS